ncbi:MAG: hypothetical protein L0387_03340 [Acidobacteria bacterium]|nr:hypothetical protein [Acidobacteriota bacterium]MCI0719260.1 hypothetical protein [Acidobacteriota bacterium]
MKLVPCICLLLVIFAGIESAQAAAPAVSYDGSTMSLTAENQTFGQVMGLFQQQTGLEFEIPGDLNGLRLPLVEFKNLSMKDALLKVLEGSNYDYILVAAPGQPDFVRKLVIPGKSSKISAAAGAFRAMNRPAMEDPFGGGIETTIEDNANVQPDPAATNPPPTQNPPPQGFAPVQPGVQPVPVNPNQTSPGVVAPQQVQPQGLQPFTPYGNQNNRRSPY